MSTRTIGFIGLGGMGLPMATHLVKAGLTVVGFDLRPEAAEAFIAAGGQIAPNAAETVRQADVLLTCLVSPAMKKVTTEAILPHIRAAQVLIDHSTVPAPWARWYAAQAADRGAIALDAPITGGTGGAQNATLRMFVGGDRETFEAHEPMLRHMARKIVYGGGPGQGQALKVVQQLKDRLLDAARLEILAFGRHEGLSWEQILAALDVEPGSDDGYARLVRQIEAGRGDELGCLFTEWDYYLEEAREKAIPMPCLEGMYRHCADGPHVNIDGQGRHGPSVWNELMRGRGSN